MDHLVLERLDSTPTHPGDTGCSLAETIGEIDQKAFNPDEYFLENLHASACSYTMGLGIFAALYRRLGEEEFRRGFGSLYLKISNLEHEDQCTGVETGICYVQKAFVDEASPGFAEAAGEVIDYWYYGTGATWIRGTVLGPSGEPLEGIGIWAWQGQQENSSWGSTKPDGTFSIGVPDGSFTLVVYADSGAGWTQLGWYDGAEGLVAEESRAARIVIDGASVEGIEIRSTG